MIIDKDPIFLLKTISIIMNWERTEHHNDINHIHGSKDHTILIRNVDCDFVVDGGSHMMTLPESDKINTISETIL